jgi:CheY-like chemotaxis protein
MHLSRESSVVDISSNLNMDKTNLSYSFCPRPSKSSVDGTFRILVADDVKMLRKGLVHGLLKLFQDIPLSICTACTAEDVLRATSSEPFDLVICDNQFLHEDVTTIKVISKDVLKNGRPRLRYDRQKNSRAELHKLITDYFENESFTLKDGDGELSGFEALQQIAESKDSLFPTPILILLSGHKWEAPPSPGVIVVQKPLNQSGFIPLLESQAFELLDTGFCVQSNTDVDGTSISSNYSRLVNRHGSQIFVAR